MPCGIAFYYVFSIVFYVTMCFIYESNITMKIDFQISLVPQGSLCGHYTTLFAGQINTKNGICSLI